MLPGRTLHVGLALWYLAGVRKSRSVKPTWRTWRQFGLSHDAARRGLGILEQDGLVVVARHPGRCPVATILDVPDTLQARAPKETQGRNSKGVESLNGPRTPQPQTEENRT